jgi:hypothetical protein
LFLSLQAVPIVSRAAQPDFALAFASIACMPADVQKCS